MVDRYRCNRNLRKVYAPAVGVDLEDGEADGALLVLVVRRGRGVGVAQRVALDDGARGAARRRPPRLRRRRRLRRAHHRRHHRARPAQPAHPAAALRTTQK